MAIQEFDLDSAPIQAHAPLFAQTVRLAVEALRRAGFRTGLGLDLPSLFQEAGIPALTLGADSPIGGVDGDLFEVLADTIGSLLPAIARFGLASEADVRVETLSDRLRDEARESGRPVIGMPLVSAYARTPAAES
jgi:hypothetical protein